MKHFCIFLLGFSTFIAKFMPIAIANKGDGYVIKSKSVIYILENNRAMATSYPNARVASARELRATFIKGGYDVLHYGGTRLTAKGAVAATILTYLPFVAAGISGGLGYGIYEVNQNSSNVDSYI